MRGQGRMVRSQLGWKTMLFDLWVIGFYLIPVPVQETSWAPAKESLVP